MTPKAGTRLKSAVSETEVIVVRPPTTDVDLRCGGVAMVELGADAPAGATMDDAHRAGTLLGKRYVDEASGIELLCTKAGECSLSIGDTPLHLKEAKPLPSSD
jgi:hypothetical protein